MATTRRFNDITRWDSPWYLELPKEFKILHDYIWEHADTAGIWTINWTKAARDIGIEKISLGDLPAGLRKRYQVIGNKKSLVILDFLRVTQGSLGQKKSDKQDFSSYHLGVFRCLADAECTLLDIWRWHTEADLGIWQPYTEVLKAMAMQKYINIKGYDVTRDVRAIYADEMRGQPNPCVQAQAPTTNKRQAQEIWRNVSKSLAETVDAENYTTWIATLEATGIAGQNGDSVFGLRAPSEFNRKWVERHFIDDLRPVLAQASERSQISVIIDVAENQEEELED